MMLICSDLVKDTIVVLRDDYSVVCDSFVIFLDNIAEVLKRCEEYNLFQNWEKCHFMVKEGILLGHHLSGKGKKLR